MNQTSYRFNIIDDYTYEKYMSVKIEDKEEDKEKIYNWIKDKSILMIPDKKKFFKHFRKDGMPIFTENLDYCKFFDNLCLSYKTIIQIYNYIKENPHKNNLIKMLGSQIATNYNDRKIKSCQFEFY